MLLRGSNAVGYTNYADNVVQRFVEEAAKSGIDVFRVFDALNWTKGMAVAMEAVRKQNRILEAAVCYTGDITDPKRDKYPLAYYVKLAKELESMGAHFLAIKDMAGLLKPFAARKLVKALKQEVGLPIHLHTHDTSGIASATLLEAAQAGVDVVDAALSSLSGLTAQPNLNSLVAALKGTEWDSAPRRGRPAAARQLLGDGARVLRAVRVGAEERHRRGLPARDPGRPVLQLQAAGRRARPPRQVGGVQGHVPQGQPALRRRHQGDAVVEGGGRHGDVPREERARAGGPLHREGEGSRLPGVGHRLRAGACSASSTAASRRSCRRSSCASVEPITSRPGELIEPVDFDAERKKAEARIGHPIDAKALVSYLLYPNVYPDLDRHKDEFSDTSVIPTPVFLYGLEPGQETSIDIEPGKTLIVKLNTIGKLHPDGTRDLYFELNGDGRSVTIRDQAAATTSVTRPKADKGNPLHVGAPMPGKVVKVAVKPGDKVAAGAVLMVTEAMKMETNIKAKADCIVGEVKFKEGDKIEKDDLIFVLA